MNATTTIDTRAPHRATRAVVEAQGIPAAQALYDFFEVANRRFFDGKLAAALIFIAETKSRRALGDYCPRDAQGLESRIRIAPHVFRSSLGSKLVEDVLLHEMVHAWQEEVDQDGEDGYRGHGPKFAARCNAIGELLGLPPVGIKGRDGLPDCAHWPCNVRPAGYYAKAWTKPTRAPSKKTGAGIAGETGEDAPPARRARNTPAKVREGLNAIKASLAWFDLDELAELAEAVREAAAAREALDGGAAS